MGSLLKIVITGPESSGKTSLGLKLAESVNAQFIPEYARIYLEEHGPDYDFQRISDIALMHLNFQQDQLKQAKGLVFLDTDLINFLCWQEFVYGRHDPQLAKLARKESHPNYLLTYPDLPWEEDPLREHPGKGLEIFELHKDWIERLGRQYCIIKGQGDERTKLALKAVADLSQ